MMTILLYACSSVIGLPWSSHLDKRSMLVAADSLGGWSWSTWSIKLQLRKFTTSSSSATGRSKLFRKTTRLLRTRNFLVSLNVCHAFLLYPMYFYSQNDIPYIPTVPGLDVYGGKVMHASQYRVPEVFAGQNVLIIGGGASAVDVTSQLAPSAKQVSLNFSNILSVSNCE